MESRKRARRGTAPSRVAASTNTAEPAFLPNIAFLLEDGGQISIGALPPIRCAAVATTDYNCLAMLQRRPAEPLQQLLERLDAAIEHALETDELIDEINAPPLPMKEP